MYTYVQRLGCKKENMATYVYIRAGSRTPTRALRRLELALVFPKEEGMMLQSSVSISLSF